MKVLFFISEYDRFNGGQRSLRQLLIELPKNGITPVVVFPGNGKCQKAFEEAGINCRILQAPAPLMEFGQHLLHMSIVRKFLIFAFHIVPYSFRIWRLMRRNDIDILHCNTSRSLLLSSFMPRLMGKKTIWHVRGELNGLSTMMRTICERLSNSIWLVAKVLTNQIGSKSQHKSFVIYNGIGLDSVHNYQAGDVPQNEKFTVCTFAAVTPFKGYHHLIDAVDIVSQTDSSIEFLAVGDLFDKEYLTFLEKRIEDKEITNFKFLGWRDNPFEYYKKADLVVLPTVVKEELEINGTLRKVQTGEGLPRTILEAMFLEKLIVATRVAGSPEQIIDGEHGFLVEPGDKEQLAQAIIKAWELPESEKAKMRKAAGERARNVFDASKLSMKAAEKLKLMLK